MPGMMQGQNIGYKSGQGDVEIQGPGIIYQTIKTTTNNILKPVIQNQQSAG